MYRLPDSRQSQHLSLLLPVAVAVVLLSGIIVHPTQAQFTWGGAKNNNWSNAGNWSPAGGPPNGIDVTTIFNVGTQAITDNVNLNVTVGAITINQPDTGVANVTIKNSGTNVLTFQTTTGNATFTNQLAAGAVNDGTGTVTVSAPIQLNSPLDVYTSYNLTSNTSLTFSGGVTGDQPITLYGGGNLQITADSGLFTGPLVVNNGALRISGNYLTGAGDVTVNSGGQFQFGSDTATDWSLGVGAIVHLNGSGKAAGVNNQGALRFQNNHASTNFNTPIDLQSSAAIYINGNLGGDPPTVGAVTVTQPISGAGVLTKNGTGVLILANDNTYSAASPTLINGGTLVLANTINDGGYAVPGDVTIGTVTNTNPTVLQIGASGQQLPANANVTLVGSTAVAGINGTFNLNGFDQTIGSLNSTAGGGIVQNNAPSGNATLTVNAASVSSSYSGVIQDSATPGTSTFALALSGDPSHSLTLTGDNTYTGGTTVNGAALIAANATGSATGLGPVTVNVGGALGGSGFITGPVSFVGGTLAPSYGGATPSTLTLGSTTFDPDSILNYQLSTAGTAGGGVNDLTAVNGDLALAGILNINALAGFGPGVYPLFTYTGTLLDSGLSIGNLPNGFSATLDESNPGEVDLKVELVGLLLGDVNFDGIVNLTDLTLVASNWNALGVGVAGDANGDNRVDLLDLTTIASNWLHSSHGGPPPVELNGLVATPVPEPGSWLLLVLGASIMVSSRYSRARKR